MSKRFTAVAGALLTAVTLATVAAAQAPRIGNGRRLQWQFQGGGTVDAARPSRPSGWNDRQTWQNAVAPSGTAGSGIPAAFR